MKMGLAYSNFRNVFPEPEMQDFFGAIEEWVNSIISMVTNNDIITQDIAISLFRILSKYDVDELRIILSKLMTCLRYNQTIEACFQTFNRGVVSNNYISFIRFLFNLDEYNENDDNFFRFFWACICGHLEKIKQLLSLPNLDVTRHNNTVLIEAHKQQQYKVIELLLADKRQIKIPLNLINNEPMAILILKRFRQKRWNYQYHLNKIRVMNELLVLPEEHVHSDFPGGSRYQQLLTQF